MFSFGPTSGAQRCLIVRDWVTGGCPRRRAPLLTPETRSVPEGPPAAPPPAHAAPRPLPAPGPPRCANSSQVGCPKRLGASVPGPSCLRAGLVSFLGCESTGEAWGGNLWFSERDAEPAVRAPQAGVGAEARLAPRCPGCRLRPHGALAVFPVIPSDVGSQGGLSYLPCRNASVPHPLFTRLSVWSREMLCFFLRLCTY